MSGMREGLTTGFDLAVSLSRLRWLGDALGGVFGPTGGMLVSVDELGNCSLSGDGLFCLEHLVAVPAASVLPIWDELVLSAARSQKAACGDGATALVMLAGFLADELLRMECAASTDRRLAAARELLLSLQDLRGFCEDVGAAGARVSGRPSAVLSVLNCVLRNVAPDIVHAAAKACQQSDRVVICRSLSSADATSTEGFLPPAGEQAQPCRVVSGVVVSRGFCHPRSPSELAHQNVLLFSCPLDPAIKTRHTVPDGFSKAPFLAEFALSLLSAVRGVDAGVVVCQWAIAPAVTEALYQAGVHCLSYVQPRQLEDLALLLHCSICSSPFVVAASHVGTSSRIVSVPAPVGQPSHSVFEATDGESGAVTTVILPVGCGDNVVAQLTHAVTTVQHSDLHRLCESGTVYERRLARFLESRGRLLLSRALDRFPVVAASPDCCLPAMVKETGIKQAVEIVVQLLRTS